MSRIGTVFTSGFVKQTLKPVHLRVCKTNPETALRHRISNRKGNRAKKMKLLLFFLLLSGFSAFFTFRFLLAFLDDFGLRRSCRFRRDHFGWFLFFDLECDDVS